jgi:hypothetical protein
MSDKHSDSAYYAVTRDVQLANSADRRERVFTKTSFSQKRDGRLLSNFHSC